MRRQISFMLLAGLLAIPSIGQEPSPAAQPDKGSPNPSPMNEEAKPVDIKAGVHPPRATYQPEAEYPYEARRNRLDGKCSIALIVDANGMPQNVHVIRCSNSQFAPSSLEAISKYRFSPATTAEGKPIPVRITVETNFQVEGGHPVINPIRSGFASPPGTLSTGPDADGVYQLTKSIVSPSFTKFVDQGYATTAFTLEGNSSCDLTLTLDVTGKPVNATAVRCTPENLAQSAVKSLMSSRFKPATLQGKPVPVRLLVHLEYGEFAAQQKR